MYLSTWLPVGSTAWERLRNFGTLRTWRPVEEAPLEGDGEADFESLVLCPTSDSFSLLPECCWHVICQLPAPAAVMPSSLFWILPSRTASCEKCFLKLPLVMVFFFSFHSNGLIDSESDLTSIQLPGLVLNKAKMTKAASVQSTLRKVYRSRGNRNVYGLYKAPAPLSTAHKS